MKPIKGYENKYLITPNGEIFSLLKNRYLKLSLAGAGYLTLRVLKDNKQKSFYVHRLVAMMFLDNWNPTLDVNHKDGNKLNNHVSNLEMVTKSQNTLHGYSIGLLHKNQKHYRTNLSRDDARAIKYGFPTLSHCQVGFIYNLGRGGVQKIRTNTNWRGL